MRKGLLLILGSLVFISCDTSIKKEGKLSVASGEITVAVDESFKPIADAQINAYKGHYPEAKFNIIYMPEQKAINYMTHDSADLVMVSRELTKEEQIYYTTRELKYLPAVMALDAVCLIVNKDSKLSEISMDELGAIMKGEKSDFKLVFDNSSSSNLNLMLHKFNIEEINRTNIFAGSGTLDVFDRVEGNKNIIGLVGLNWMSDDDDKDAVALRKRIRTLGIKAANDSKAIYPSALTLKSDEYPLRKLIYLHTTQRDWGVAMGFVRFACTQIGQLVVEKMGLQPNYIFPKYIELHNTDPVNIVE